MRTEALVADARVEAGELSVAYADLGDAEAVPAVLLHGYPYDIHSYDEVASLLVRAGYRVIVPYLRGHGGTLFRSVDTPRSGQQAALGSDLVALIDALQLKQPIVAGFDWGGRAACIAAAIAPEKIGGLVSVNGYLFQNIDTAGVPLRPDLEAGFWYFWYFTTERGRSGLSRHRREIADVIWRRNSPEWAFTTGQLERTAEAFGNPDYVEVVIHSYRHRLGLAPGFPQFEGVERALLRQPIISVPSVTLDGEADGNFPATSGDAIAHLFSGPWEHRRVAHAGHNLPAEAPAAFVDAIFAVAGFQNSAAGTP